MPRPFGSRCLRFPWKAKSSSNIAPPTRRRKTALHIFKGSWKWALAPERGLTTGAKVGFHNDSRVHSVASLLPHRFEGMSILELGPFEGYDSQLFEQLGAAKVVAIEGNNINFLKSS